MYRCREAIFLWRVNKLDFLVWLTAFIIVVFAGVEAGLASAVGLSLLIVLWKVPPAGSPPCLCSACCCAARMWSSPTSCRNVITL